MPTITREQYHKLNSQAPSGWEFDLQHFLTWGEKQISQTVKLEENRAIIATICYRENRITRRNSYGQEFNVPAGHHRITMHIGQYTTRDGKVWVGGQGSWVDLDQGQHLRKNYKALCDIAKNIDADLIKSQAK